MDEILAKLEEASALLHRKALILPLAGDPQAKQALIELLLEGQADIHRAREKLATAAKMAQAGHGKIVDRKE